MISFSLMTTPQKVHMLCCASSLVIATYAKVGLIPHDSRALPLALFSASSEKCDFLRVHHQLNRQNLFLFIVI